MTDLVPPPYPPSQDLNQRLRQAREDLRAWSNPPLADAVSAKELRECARREIKELSRQLRRK